MAKCEICGKGVTFGIKVSHSHRRSNRTWKPNVRKVRAIVTVHLKKFVLAHAVFVQERFRELYNHIGLNKNGICQKADSFFIV